MSQPWFQLLGDPIIGATAILLLVAVLGGASWHKFLDRIAFRETLRDYQVLPEAAVGPAATIVPAVELTIIVSESVRVSRVVPAVNAPAASDHEKLRPPLAILPMVSPLIADAPVG